LRVRRMLPEIVTADAVHFGRARHHRYTVAAP
jgi:ribosome biogenesis protein Tsr3